MFVMPIQQISRWSSEMLLNFIVVLTVCLNITCELSSNYLKQHIFYLYKRIDSAIHITYIHSQDPTLEKIKVLRVLKEGVLKLSTFFLEYALKVLSLN